MVDSAGSIFVVTVVDLGHESAHQEVAHIAEALHAAARDVRAHGGTKRSGEILGAFAKVIGHWEFTSAGNGEQA